MATKKAEKEATIEIAPIKMSRLRANIVGETPMIMHRFDAKAVHELLLPKPKANRAEREESLKHDPVGEFRGAVYLNRSRSEPTAVHIPAGSFSAALASAALDLPGASKAQIKRLTTIRSLQINLYGTPYLKMDMVRSSDINRTPDVRTRPCFKEWCCTIDVEFVSSLIKEGQVVNLLGAAGAIVGIGDWRPQKGGMFGKFRVVDDNDADFKRIVKGQARAVQEEALNNPVCYDADTEELLAWFVAETARREKHVPSSGRTIYDVVEVVRDEDSGLELPAPAASAKATRKRGNGASARA